MLKLQGFGFKVKGAHICQTVGPTWTPKICRFRVQGLGFKGTIMAIWAALFQGVGPMFFLLSGSRYPHSHL